MLFDINNNADHGSEADIVEISPNVLIVDDEPMQIDSLQQLLTLSGYQVDTASNGMEAIEMLKKYTFEVMLLDLNMPGLSGFDVLDFVSEMSIEVKTVVVSGESGFEITKSALKKGAYDYIKKPYVADELLSTIKNAAHRKELEDNNKSIRQKLEESEYLHRFIVDHSPDIVFIVDTKGNFEFLNDTVFSLLGYNIKMVSFLFCF